MALAAALGALLRLLPFGCKLWDKYFGDVVYAMVFYLASIGYETPGSQKRDTRGPKTLYKRFLKEEGCL